MPFTTGRGLLMRTSQGAELCGDDGMASWAQKLERRAGQRVDRRVLTALLASTVITLLLIAPYVVRAL